ncbi:hypothetical protein RJT34_24280 [Clitoria ternatea]|uniref:Methyltransferase n=1 Tax=Clitoria ternatea TaxID=43366 RepID=A0AAN9IHW1_CLITE
MVSEPGERQTLRMGSSRQRRESVRRKPSETRDKDADGVRGRQRHGTELRELWQGRVENYWNLMSSKISSNTLRNVMGSFAAGLRGRDVWVMNAVQPDGPPTLKLIYDRGLIGTTHDWCEAFSSYPRTYDLLHAWTVFSGIEKKDCSPEDLLIEMDRLLRPTGFIIVRDKQHVIDFIKRYLTVMHWEAVATADASPDSHQDGNEVTFVIQKKLGLTTESLREVYLSLHPHSLNDNDSETDVEGDFDRETDVEGDSDSTLDST